MKKTRTSGRNISLWEEHSGLRAETPLDRNTRADVCVIGAGVAGLTSAYCLARAGRKVVVLDKGPLCAGETKQTTAHLSCVIDDHFTEIERLHGVEGARMARESHAAAIDFIEETIRREEIACDFERVDGYLYPGKEDDQSFLDDELEAARRAGHTAGERLDAAKVEGFPAGPCLRFPGQAQIHPLRYLYGLARKLEAMGVQLYTSTFVEDLVDGSTVTVSLKNGPKIEADAVVVATNTPINERIGIHTKQYPYRTYVVGGLVPRGKIGRALFWDTLDPYHYVRVQSTFDAEAHGVSEKDWEVLVVGGEDHKTGQSDDMEERFHRLEVWAREYFPMMTEVIYNWSGQVMEPLDGLAFIGRSSKGGNVYIATGDSGMGMTHGTIAGMLLTDLIQGKENPWATLYDPSRRSLKALDVFLKENINVAGEYLKHVTPAKVSSTDEIAPRSGAVIRDGGKKVAVYRDEYGELHRRSAVCPHLGCVVTWNDSTGSWDCPCHGSRFDPYGEVLTGPATRKLDGG